MGGTEDISLDLSNYIWIMRYEVPELRDIKAKKVQANQLFSFLKKLGNKGEEYMIAESHKHAYDFIKDNMLDFENQDIEIVNIDFHHDLYDEYPNDELHCGNWLYKLMKDNININLKWICQNDSELTGYNGELDDRVTIIRDDIKKALTGKYDLIYICRSNVWSPPHLDTDFNRTFEWIIEDRPTKLQRGIFNKRM